MNERKELSRMFKKATQETFREIEAVKVHPITIYLSKFEKIFAIYLPILLMIKFKIPGYIEISLLLKIIKIKQYYRRISKWLIKHTIFI